MNKFLLLALAAASCLLGSTSSMATKTVPLNTATAFTYLSIVGTNVVTSFLFDEPLANAIEIDLGSHGSGTFGFDAPVTGSAVGFDFTYGTVEQVSFGGFQPEPAGSTISVLAIAYDATEADTITGTYTFIAVPEPATVNETRSAARAYTLAAVPEPATWAMMLAGLGMIGFANRRRQTNLAYA